MSTMLAYPSMVALVKCQGAKVDFWQVHRTKCDTRIDVSDQGLAHYLTVRLEG
jgi:hypothetical protein